MTKTLKQLLDEQNKKIRVDVWLTPLQQDLTIETIQEWLMQKRQKYQLNIDRNYAQGLVASYEYAKNKQETIDELLEELRQ